MRTFLAIALFVITFSLYGWIDTKCGKWKYNILSTVLVFTVVCFLIPGNFFLNIPFIGYGTIGKFVEDMFLTTNELKALTEFDKNIYPMTIELVGVLSKVSFIYIVDSLTLMISAIIFYFKDKIGSGESEDYQGIKTISLSFAALLMFMTPVNSIFNLLYEANSVMVEGDKDLLEEYPGLKKYSILLKPALSMAKFSNKGILSTEPYTNLILDFNNTYDNYIQEIKKAENLVSTMEASGLTMIFTDPNFKFANIKKGMFNFEKLKQAAKEAEDCKICGDAGLYFANTILDSLETVVKQESGTNKEVYLKLTKSEYQKQYLKLIELIEFAVNNDIVNEISHRPIKVLFQLLTQKGLSFSISLIKMDIIKDVLGYFENMSTPKAGIYLCARLYDMLDDWLINFRKTELFHIGKNFLKAKGVV